MSGHCAIAGCTKPVARQADGGAYETCGEFHHNLLMSERRGETLVDGDGLNSLKAGPIAGCNKKPFDGENCCSKEHALLLMREVSEKFSDRKCKFPGCCKHSFVEMKEDGSPRIHEFCSWSHCKDFHIGCNQAVIQEPSEEFLVESLKRWVLQEESGSMEVDESFFSKHPWEVLPAGAKSKYIIAKCKYKDKGCIQRDMQTKENFHWKQQGKKHTRSNTVEQLTIGDNNVTKRYLTYRKLGSKAKCQDGAKESSFTMIEYQLQEGNKEIDLRLQRWCIVKIARGQTGGNLGRVEGSKKRLKVDRGVPFPSLDPQSTKDGKQAVDPILEMDNNATMGTEIEIARATEELTDVITGSDLEVEMPEDWYTHFY